ncbi:MAG TPA: VWA domain-containing protein [Thermoanaerobaculia bacterium]|nr:VWA domain-containing protein [Thermoanaerobaculia bacterium]
MRIALLLLAVLPIAAHAQETFFSETVDVRIINVDVIVTDRKGAPATGLTKDDFEVLEGGVKQEITNFFEYRGLPAGSGVRQSEAAAPAAGTAPATADLRSRYILLFIDDDSLNLMNRNRIYPAAKDFVQAALRPGDVVMIVRWKPGLELALEATGDLAAVQKKLDALAETSAGGGFKKLEFSDFKRHVTPRGGQSVSLEQALELAKLYANERLEEQHRKVEAIRGVIASMRGIEARKVFVLVSESLTEEPGRASFEYLDSIKEMFEGGKNFVQEVVTPDYRDNHLVERLAEAANSAGVTLYPIHAGGLGSETEQMSAEIKYGSETGFRVAPETKTFAMRQIAEATGGVATTLSNNFKLGFETIANDLNSYYSIGYRAGSAKQDVVRTIDVKLKKKGYTLRTRNSFVEKSLTSEMSDAVAANLFYPADKNDLKLALSAGTKVAADAESAKVTVTITIPTASLTLLPDGEDLAGRFSTYAAFVRHDGVVSQVRTQTHQVRFPAASLSRRKEITLKLDVTVDNVTDGLSIGVMDELSRTTGFATTRL